MPKRIVLVLILTFLVESCSSARISPAPRPSATVPPTVTPSPAPSTTLTNTPYPSLKTQGPYLLFQNTERILTIMDADGLGRKQIELLNSGYVWDLEKAVSPAGKWLAYFTGATQEPYDLSLNLFNL